MTKYRLQLYEKATRVAFSKPPNFFHLETTYHKKCKNNCKITLEQKLLVPGFRLFAIDKKSAYCFVLVFLMAQNPKCPGCNQRKNNGEKLKYQNISATLFLLPLSPVLANIHSIFASVSCCHVSLDVGLPHSPLLVQCRQIVYDAGPNTTPTLGLLYT